MTVAIVRYNAGNILSVINAVKRLGVEPVLTDDAATLRRADRVIFPGQGEARSAMRYLRERGLDAVLRSLTQPVLGICIGLQLLCRHTEENDTEGLGVFAERVRRFPPTGKVPHVGWNTLDDATGPLFDGLPATPYVYYLHSYYAETGPDTLATTDYLVPFSAALHRDNFFAVQFHPEKSGPVGETILRNFLNLSR